ncbi:hypothetical protein EMIT0P294_110150 [Pseudomonas sp. IT-P294]
MSLLAIAVAHSTFIFLTHRYREQAHSYRGAALIQWHHGDAHFRIMIPAAQNHPT